MSDLLCASGQQFHDWSAACRLFEHQRVDPSRIRTTLQSRLFARLPEPAPVVALMDDTLPRRRGRRISGASWRISRVNSRIHPCRRPVGSEESPNAHNSEIGRAHV